MQRFLVDEHLPRRMSFWSAENYQFVVDLQIGMNDQDVWRYALLHELTLVTKDLDFLDLALKARVAPHLIVMQTGNQGKRELYALLEAHWGSICQMSVKHQIVRVRDGMFESVP